VTPAFADNRTDEDMARTLAPAPRRAEDDGMRLDGSPTLEAFLAEAVRRIVSAVTPDRIILFGSAAKGTMGPNSDIDLLVVKAGKYEALDVMSDIYKALRGVGHAIDVVVVTPEDLEKYRDTHCMVIKPALREGRTIYGA
jgi:predicted nucleotidyltransferase